MASKLIVFMAVVTMIAVVREGMSVAAAKTPNSWFSCMDGCLQYNCKTFPLSPTLSNPLCYAYCSILCAIPPKGNTLHADHFCKLGCISSKCTTMMGSAEGMDGCINACSNICTSSSSTTTNAAN